MSDRNVYHNRRARKKQIRRNRIIFAVLLLVLLGLFIAGLKLIFDKKDDGKSSAPSSQAASSQMQESEKPSKNPFKKDPTPTPTPTPEPEPENPYADYEPEWDTEGREGFPYLLAVNRVGNTVTVYEKDEEGNYTVPYRAFTCSSGRDTPVGVFKTSDQYTWRALFGGVYGQYATRITTDILFHSVPYLSQNKDDLEYEEYNKLGTKASLGCIRMRVIDCKWIYDECPSGTTVVLYDNEDVPGPLGQPDYEPIDLESENRGWDPTDPDPANPWKNS